MSGANNGSVFNLKDICLRKKPSHIAAFCCRNKRLRASFKIFQKVSYPLFVEFCIDIVDEEKWIIIMPRIIQGNRR